MSPAETVRGLAEEAPDLVRLAEEVSLAVQVDPALLRRARLDLGPRASAGTEADLWFSPLVRSRSPAGFVLMPELAAELRGRLARDPARLAAARARVARVHANLPPALRLEEELLWLSVRPDGAARRELEERFQVAVAALVRDGRQGIAHWAARALPALPVEVQSLEPARILDAGARLRLAGDGGALTALAEDPTTRRSGWMVPRGFPTTTVFVRLLEDGIEMAARAEAPGHAIQVPSTDPLLVELYWRDSAGDALEASGLRIQGEAVLAGLAVSPWIQIAPGGVARVPGPVLDGVRLRTISGHTYEVRPVPRSRPAREESSPVRAPEAAGPEALFLEHLDWIERVAKVASMRGGLRDAETEDFVSLVRQKLIEDDYASIRGFRGTATLKTYLATRVTRLFSNYIREQRGRWRSSAQASRLGPPAPELEELVYRDGYRLDQAGEKLRTAGRTTLSDRELGRLLRQLPPRGPLRPQEVPNEILEVAAGGQRADHRVVGAEAEANQAQVRAALGRALERLNPEERLIVQMYFGEERTVADVARALNLDQKPLYRRIARLRELLRGYMEEEGISLSTVRSIREVDDD